MRSIGITSRVDDVRNASVVVCRISIGTSSSSTAIDSTTSARVTPARHPLLSGGVTSRPSYSTKMFVPVPSHRLPIVLAKIASDAPRAVAWASATTFSA